uniref:Uncharacterized protein n=1 Tax=Panagrolaimus sp. ES5 TaxID=591445 RepID=A0AC34FLG5_9BILA
MKPTAGGWICYVEIVHISGQNYIRAGELINLTHHVECLENDMMNEIFCCSDVFSTKQNDTLCTVEKLIKYNKNARNNDHSESGTENEIFSNCMILDLPLASCLSESGCFETRMLEYSKNSDSLEPAGCIDNTEKYISEDNSLASLSLGCRVPENSNKCSVVSSVDGNQRILCCCNGEECKNDATNLPKEIGKKILSFKDPK